jgi:hypothetical protein
MGRPRRRGSVTADRNPESLARRLPESLREFVPSIDPRSYRDHLAAVAAMVGDHLAHPVMSHAGLSAADWYKRAFAQKAALEAAERIHAPGAYKGDTGEAQNVCQRLSERPNLRVVASIR